MTVHPHVREIGRRAFPPTRQTAGPYPPAARQSRVVRSTPAVKKKSLPVGGKTRDLSGFNNMDVPLHGIAEAACHVHRATSSGSSRCNPHNIGGS